MANRKKSSTTVCLSLTLILCFCFTSFGCAQKKAVLDSDGTLYEKTFTEGEPNLKVEFPEDAFEKAKVYMDESKYLMAEKILMNKLDDAKEAGRGTVRLGKYLVRLNNCLRNQGKDSEAIKFGEIALKIFYNQPLDKRPLAPWFVNIHSYLALSYDRQSKYDKAVEHYLKAIQDAAAAPKAEISPLWMKLLYEQLAGCYEKQNKKEAAEKIREKLAEFNGEKPEAKDDKKTPAKKNTR
ncbi:MAG: tetratricopeptide repeat protein [Candidatus Obscuribacterales bacterium]|nr:tetratricopeptide repeat protein [Candidatus Obscuribacterales bacterium]